MKISDLFLFMFLESDRLILRKLTLSDDELLYHLDSDPEVLKYIRPAISKEESLMRLHSSIKRYDSFPGLGRFVAFEKDTREDIGWYILSFSEEVQLPEIGYRLKQKYWGKGYATELSLVLLDYGFRSLDIDKIFAVTHQQNLGSQNVLTKIGMKYVDIRHIYENDVFYYELRKENYLKGS